jgi:hypothetical protein
VLCRTGIVGKLHYLESTLRVRDHPNTRMALPDLGNMERKKSLMDRTMSLPQNHAAAVQDFGGVSAEIFERIPHRHLFQPQTQGISRISTEVLIRQEQDPVSAFQSPAHDRSCVGRRTDRAVMTPAKRFDACGRVHISDRNDLARRNAMQVFPAGLDLIQGGHIRHGATGAQIRQNDFLVIAAQDVGASPP